MTRRRSLPSSPRCGKQERLAASILGWLLAYPASSALELAGAFGIHQATVYRALGRMQRAELLQVVSGYRGDARYLLTRRGIQRVALVMQCDASTLSRKWQYGLSTPARLIARLSSLDCLHRFAHQLFEHAPRALACQGYAAVVRWHVVRQWRAERMEARADGLLVWTIEESRTYGMVTCATSSLPPPSAQWEAAFVLLESGLCDAELIRIRLARLLSYREEIHRDTVPPLLILVESERQAEIWRRATRQAVRSARAEPLRGAIAIVATNGNPWQWGWRNLLTGANIQLASLFVPGPEEVILPRGTRSHIAAVQGLMRSCAGPLPLPCREEARAVSVHVKVPVVLAPREQELLTLLFRVPRMSADEIAAVTPRIPDGKPLSIQTVERLLRDLARQHLAERTLVAQGQEARWRWSLTDAGLRKVAAMHNVSLSHLRRHILRDRFMMSRQDAHLAGVYGVVAAFHRAAAGTHGAVTIAWWDVGRWCTRTYQYHGVQRNLRPDAELELVLRRGENSVRRMRIWLEYDRGSMNRRDLDRKMRSYADYWEAKEWAAEGLAALPRLLFIVPNSGQEHRVREACREHLRGARLRVLVTTAGYLQAASPFGSIWREQNEQSTRHLLWE